MILLEALFGLNNKATRTTEGITCFNSCNILGATSGLRNEVPVTFLPGCARLATTPARIGSPTATITIGIVWVATWAAWVAGEPDATTTSTGMLTSFLAASGSPATQA